MRIATAPVLAAEVRLERLGGETLRAIAEHGRDAPPALVAVEDWRAAADDLVRAEGDARRQANGIMLAVFDGDETWTCTLREFLEANAEDGWVCGQVLDLRPGEEVVLDQGAGGAFKVRRLVEVAS